MKAITILLISLFPILSIAQTTGDEKCGNVKFLIDSTTIYITRKIPVGDVFKVSERLMASYPDLVSLNINSEIDSVKLVYVQSIDDLSLNQLVNYFK